MQSTVGMDYRTKQVTIDGNTVKLAIWVRVICCKNILYKYISTNILKNYYRILQDKNVFEL